jgi:thiosulfate reductase/polysulfide reductase chain A
MIDILPSDTTMFCDVILPEASYLERTSPVATYGALEPAIVQRRAAIKPLFETKVPEQIYKELAEKLSKPLWEITKKYDEDVQDEIKGMSKEEEEEYYKENGFDLADPWEESVEKQNEEKIVKTFGEEAWNILQEKGVYYPNMEKYHKQLDVNQYQYYPESKKNYTTKKDELKVIFNFKSLARKGVDPMPTWHDEWKFSVPEGKFRLVTGRHAQFTQSGTTNNMMLRDLIPTNYLWINKRVANEKGIKFGDIVEVSSSVGKVKIKAYPTEKIAPNQVFMLHGFGGSSEGSVPQADAQGKRPVELARLALALLGFLRPPQGGGTHQNFPGNLVHLATLGAAHFVIGQVFRVEQIQRGLGLLPAEVERSATIGAVNLHRNLLSRGFRNRSSLLVERSDGNAA